MTSSSPLGKLKRVPLREAWRHEAAEFTPWLAEDDNLQALAEALGLSELELVATEHLVGDFKLDILCTDGDQQVVIENQLEETDHKHLGQILAYAAGVDARKVIWVAEAFCPEHLAALQYLNVNTTEELSFFAVQIELWQIGDSPLAPKFEVVAKPNNWARAGGEQARAVATSSPTKQLQFRFWKALAPDLSDSDRAKVKQSARELVERIKELLVLNWQQKFEARAKLKVVIEEALDIGLPRAYTPELYQQKCEAVFAHIEQAYPERDRSVYSVHG